MIKKRFTKLSSLIAVVILIASVMGITTLAATNQSFAEIPTFYAKDCFVQAGDTVTVEICIENNPGILNATLTLSFDEELTLSGVEQGDALASLEFTEPEGVGEGTASTFNFLWNGETQADTSNGTVLVLTFTVSDDAEPGTVYSLDLSCIPGDVSDDEMNPVDFEMIDGQIKVINYIPGDVDGDGDIDGDDVTALRRYIAGGYGEDINPNAADVNNDGRLNGDDLTLIRRYIAGGYGVELKPSAKCFSHSLIRVEANEATCTEDGSIEYWYCSSCNKYYRDENGTRLVSLDNIVIAALGHLAPDDFGCCPREGCDYRLPAGLYDANGELVVSWAELQTMMTEKGIIDISTGSTASSGSAHDELTTTITYFFNSFADLGYSTDMNEKVASAVQLVLPESETVIGKYAFKGVKFSKIAISPSTTSIAMAAFWGTSITSFTIPTGLTDGKINDSMFRECTDLTRVTIPADIVDIGTTAFMKCTSLTEIYFPSETQVKIGNRAVAGCKDGIVLRFKVWPKSESTGPFGTGGSFPYCKVVLAVESGEIGGITTFDGKANFETYVTSLILGKDVTSIADGAFTGCTALTSVTFEGTTTEWNALNLGTVWYEGIAATELECSDGDICLHIYNDFAECTHENCDYRLEAGLYDAEGKFLMSWEDFKAILDANNIVTSCTSCADGGTHKTSAHSIATFLGSVDTLVIDTDKASKIQSATQLVLPKDMTTVGERAFIGCAQFTKIAISPDTTAIGAQSFRETGIVSFTIPTGVTGKIGDSTFYKCTNLTSITIPDGITEVGTTTFAFCSGLTEIYFPSGTQVNIGNNAFAACTDSLVLRFKVWPKSNKSYPFGQGTSNNPATNVVLYVESGEIGGLSTFSSETNKTNFKNRVIALILGKDVTTIADGAFTECTALTSVTFEGATTEWNAENTLKLVGVAATEIVCSDGNLCIHDVVVDEAVAPTCTETGLTEGKHCSVCSEVLVAQEIVDALDHNYVDGVCTVCGESIHVCEFTATDVAPEYLAKEATCTTPATYYKQCVCGELSDTETFEDGEPRGHDYNDFAQCTRLGCPNAVDGALYRLPAGLYDANGELVVSWTELQTMMTEKGIIDISTGSTASSGADHDELTTTIAYFFNSFADLGYSTDMNEKVASAVQLVLPESETVIGKYAFKGVKFSKIAISPATTSIGVGAFWGADITSFTIPTGMTGKISDSVFYKCENLTSITIHDGINEVGTTAFAFCSGLTEVYFPSETQVNIGNNCFGSCTEGIVLKFKVWPGSESKNPFGGGNSTAATKVVLYVESGEIGGITTFTASLGQTNFKNNVTSLILGKDVTTIADGAFTGCTALTNIEFEGTTTEWNPENTLKLVGVAARVIDCSDGVVCITHDYSETDRSEPTCTATGSVTYTCSVCDHSYTETLDMLEHTPDEAVRENEKSESCKDNGSYESVIYCSVCDAEISRTTITVPATGNHVYAEETERVDATCTEDGYFTMACGCGETLTTTLSALGHAYNDFAECTREGCEYRLDAGIYDAEGNLLLSWSEFVTWFTADLTTSCGCTKGDDHTASDHSLAYFLNNVDTVVTDTEIASKIKSATQIVLPETATTIAKYAFRGCSQFTKIAVPSGTTTINAGAFTGTGIVSFTIPTAVTSIPSNCFQNCSDLERVTIHENVTSITTASAFANCTSLTELYFPSATSVTIGNKAFDGCSNITLRFKVWPKSTSGTPFGSSTTGITLVIDSGDVQGLSAFSGKENFKQAITSIILGDGITSIADGAFSGCTALTSVEFKGTKAEWNALDLGTAWYEGIAATELECSDGSICLHIYNDFAECTRENCDYRLEAGLYDAEGKFLMSWADFLTAVGKTQDTLACDCTSGTTHSTADHSLGVILADVDANVADATAAAKIKTATRVVLPADMTSVPAFFFMGCGQFTAVNVSPDTTSIGNQAFRETGIVSFTIPTGMTGTIGDSVFYKCTNLTSITIHDRITGAGTTTFAYCTSLTEVYFPSGTQVNIGNNCFAGCTEGIVLRFKVWPGSGSKYPFGQGTSNNPATNVVLYVESGEIGGLSTFTASLGQTNFKNRVTALIIGKDVASIVANAFDGCTNLATITFEGTMAEWSGVTKGSSWNGGATATVVNCSDGTYCVGGHTEEDVVSCDICDAGVCDVVGNHDWSEEDEQGNVTCQVCGATVSKCEVDGHPLTIAATCTTPESCRCGKVTKGIALGHSWVEGETEWTCSCGRSEKKLITGEMNLATTINGLPTITTNPNMTESELRDMIVGFMRAQFAFVYKADFSTAEFSAAPVFTYDIYIENLLGRTSYETISKTKYTIKDGKYYGGIPYTGNSNGNAYRWLGFYDEVTGIMNFAPIVMSALKHADRTDYDRDGVLNDVDENGNPVNIGSTLFGNSCSSSVFWAWARVTNSLASCWTGGWKPSNGYVQVGDYTIEYNAAGTSIDWDKTILGTGSFLGNKYGQTNSASTMYEAYAQMKKADGLLQKGHALMIYADPVVVHKSNGSIDPANSYVIIIEQAGSWYKKDPANNTNTDVLQEGTLFDHDDPDGVRYHVMANLPGIHKDKYGECEDQTQYVTYSFEQLYEKGFIPFTIPELSGDAEIEAVEVTHNVNVTDSITIAQLNGMTINSNYYISDVNFIVKDSEGNVVFKAMYANPDAKVRKYASVKEALNNNLMYQDSTYIKDQLSTYFTGTDYTFSIDVRVSTGDVVTVFEGTLVE